VVVGDPGNPSGRFCFLFARRKIFALAMYLRPAGGRVLEMQLGGKEAARRSLSGHRLGSSVKYIAGFRFIVFGLRFTNYGVRFTNYGLWFR
jgi:hypothetical protein